MEEHEGVDLVIIGAGWSGLAMAKTYSQVHVGDCNMVVLESAETIGGSWARERLYPGLKTNNVVGSYEFSDFPLELPRYGLKPRSHISGAVVQQYLSDFADHFGLTPKIRLSTEVEEVVLNEEDGTWRIEYSNAGKKGTLISPQLVVASGLTSLPHMPTYPGQAKFKGKLFHSKQLHSRAKDLAAAKHNVVVVGANKSALDTCQIVVQTASPDVTIHMLIRPTGRGPTWIWHKLANIRQFNVSRLTSTRLFSWFDPNPLVSPWQLWFQSTLLGKWLCLLFWALLDRCLLYAAGHPARPSEVDKEDTLSKLRPRYSSFWMGNAQANYNYDTDWFAQVQKGRIMVHHAEIDALLHENKGVRLSDGQVLQNVDAIVACTGWKSAPNFNFGPPGLSKTLEMPSTKQNEQQRAAVLKARQSIALQWPVLFRNQPQTTKTDDGSKPPPPYRLFRFMVTPEEKMLRLHNLAFVGFHQSIHTVLVAQAQALWVTAYLKGQLSQGIDEGAVACREWTYLHTEYQQLRRLGSPFPDLVVDSIPYIDLLLTDLGLLAARKRGGFEWWRELIEQYSPRDYRGIVDEWMNQKSSSGANR